MTGGAVSGGEQTSTLPLGFAADDRCFLGVKRSLRGLRWRDRLTPEAAPLAMAISQRHGLPEILGRILAGRDAGLDEVPDLMNPTLRALMPDPASLQDMGKGAARLAAAIRAGEQIAIFGDYDVDGAASSALLHRFLAAHGIDATIYIPDRIAEGYGASPEALTSLIDQGAELIITVDCGTTNHAAIAAANERGAQVIVIDHHQADEHLPEAEALINPNRQDDLSGQGHLAAAGVTFLFTVETARQLRAAGYYDGAARREPDLMALLDLAALATVCDVVPLRGINRALVAQGLKVMRHRRNPGLKALADVAGIARAPEPYHLGFLLGPRINAGGRIGDAGLGARLLSTDDPVIAQEIAARLNALNAERREMEARALEEAAAMAERALEAEPEASLLFLGSPDWHKGLIGLVASRLVERFGRPAFVFSWDEAAGQGTGSARSIAGVDLGRAVRLAVAEEIALKGGGHEMAAGITVSRGQADALRDFLSSKLAPTVGSARSEAGLAVDGALTPEAVTSELIDLIEQAGPFGAGNPTPRFVFPSHRIAFAKTIGEAHVRCTLRASNGSQIQAVAFRAVGTELGEALLNKAGGAALHVAGRLQRDHWGGRERVELHIEDAAVPQKPGG